MICYQNKDASKNIRARNGKQFALTFKGNEVYYVYADGSMDLANAGMNAIKHKAMFDMSVDTDPQSPIERIEFKDIVWKN